MCTRPFLEIEILFPLPSTHHQAAFMKFTGKSSPFVTLATTSHSVIAAAAASKSCHFYSPTLENGEDSSSQARQDRQDFLPVLEVHSPSTAASLSHRKARTNLTPLAKPGQKAKNSIGTTLTLAHDSSMQSGSA